jgi:casein kinase 1 delta/casein kinase I family protein HRR25
MEKSLIATGTDLKTNQEVAMKLMDANADTWGLRSEASTHKALEGGIGIPRLLWADHEEEYFVIVHDLLGPSLEDLLNYCQRSFSLKTVLLLADQAISRLEFVHQTGFVHRDIKPENFLMGSGKQGNLLYLIDFGLVLEVDEDRERQYENQAFGGTDRYSSINNHLGLGKRQDAVNMD